MSKPSPESKQAALLPCPFCGNQAVTEFEYEKCTYMTQCESCGAGTCASSDKDETIKDWNSRSDTATAKLRKELKEARKIIEMDSTSQGFIEAKMKFLAHQQPSAKCSDCGRDLLKPPNESFGYCLKCGQGFKQPSAITTNEQAYRDGTLSQPSAPTAENESFAPFFEDVEKKTTQELAEIVGVQGSGSRAAESHTRGLRNKSNKQTLTPATMPTADVEKIADWAVSRICGCDKLQAKGIILNALAQVSVPLVEAQCEAIEILNGQDNAGKGRSLAEITRRVEAAIILLRAALTRK